MNRRSLLRGVFGTAAGAAVASAVSEHVGAENPVMATGGNITGVWEGLDPWPFVYVEWRRDGSVAVIPHDALTPWAGQAVESRAIKLQEFPEFDPAHGIVMVTNYKSSIAFPDDEISAIRAEYVQEVAWRRDAPIFAQAWQEMGVVTPAHAQPLQIVPPTTEIVHRAYSDTPFTDDDVAAAIARAQEDSTFLRLVRHSLSDDRRSLAFVYEWPSLDTIAPQ